LVSAIWLIEFEKEAERELKKLDKQVAMRIVKFLRERVAVLENPRSIGEALTGSTLGNYWKYRVRLPHHCRNSRRNACVCSSCGYSIFGITVDRSRGFKWLFRQEKAT
jgi:hypothetical protein